MATSSLSGEGCSQLEQLLRPCHQVDPRFLLSVALRPQPWVHNAHHLFHFPRGTPRAASAPPRPPPTIIHRGSSRRFSLGLRWGQRLWTDHFRIPDAQPALKPMPALQGPSLSGGTRTTHSLGGFSKGGPGSLRALSSDQQTHLFVMLGNEENF